MKTQRSILTGTLAAACSLALTAGVPAAAASGFLKPVEEAPSVRASGGCPGVWIDGGSVGGNRLPDPTHRDEGIYTTYAGPASNKNMAGKCVDVHALIIDNWKTYRTDIGPFHCG